MMIYSVLWVGGVGSGIGIGLRSLAVCRNYFAGHVCVYVGCVCMCMDMYGHM